MTLPEPTAIVAHLRRLVGDAKVSS